MVDEFMPDIGFGGTDFKTWPTRIAVSAGNRLSSAPVSTIANASTGGFFGDCGLDTLIHNIGRPLPGTIKRVPLTCGIASRKGEFLIGILFSKCKPRLPLAQR